MTLHRPTQQPTSHTPTKTPHKLELGIFRAVHMGLMNTPIALTPVRGDDVEEDGEFETPNDSPIEAIKMNDALEMPQTILFPQNKAFAARRITLRTLLLTAAFLGWICVLGVCLIAGFFLSASLPVGSSTLEKNQVIALGDIATTMPVFSSYLVRSEEPLQIFSQKPRYESALEQIASDGSDMRLWLNVGSVVHENDGTVYRIASEGEHVALSKSVDHVEAVRYDFQQSTTTDCTTAPCALPSAHTWIGSNDHSAGLLQIEGQISVVYRAVVCSFLFVMGVALSFVLFLICFKKNFQSNKKPQQQRSEHELDSVVLSRV